MIKTWGRVLIGGMSENEHASNLKAINLKLDRIYSFS